MKDFASKGGKKLVTALEKYKYVLLVLLAGLLLLLLPTFGGDAGKGTPREKAAETGSPFAVETLEAKLNAALSQVEGAGQVRVVLTVKTGPRQVLAQDVTASEREGAVERSTRTVVASSGSAGQEAVLLQEVSPTFQGALVVCPGGDDPGIQLKLMEAVSALTGLGADKISICKGK